MSIDARGCYTDRSDRLPAPWRKSEAVVNLSWHHVIPYAMMCDCWQALARNQELGKCQVAIESYLRIVKVENPRTVLRAMAAGSLGFDAQEQLERKLAWPGWNIVEGPTRRSDDPKDNRSLDGFTSGITVSESNRQRKISDLFIAFGIFNEASAGGRVSEDAAQAVANVINNAERTLMNGDVIRYRATMWVETKPPRDAPLEDQKLTWWKKKPGVSFIERR
ncbi:MAG: hypothetical protein LAP87_29640 [Acidobacteriia bacterium]|nr:hypothetical protein [Terriglobia bacterium]